MRNQKVNYVLCAMAMLLWLFVIVTQQGCSTYKEWVKTTNKVPEECLDSIVYSVIPAADLTKGIIQASLRFYEGDEDYIKWAVSVHEKAIALAEDPETTNEEFGIAIIEIVNTANELSGKVLLVITKVTEAFAFGTEAKQPMNECDREYIIDFCTQRLDYLKSVQSEALLDFFYHYTKPAMFAGNSAVRYAAG